MNVIMMEKSDFDRLVGRIEEIAEHICKSEKEKSSDRTDRWLSGTEAMDILGVSPRTLQRYRSTGRIPFSKIGKRCRYRLSDVERALDKYRINDKEESPDELHRQYLIRTGKMPEVSKET
ncbi:MAG: helix-turn-helix domain-containing protein [Bacteroidaceae bacterium]